MPTNCVAAFIQPMPECATNPVHIVPLYRAMALTCTFDVKAVALQRTNRLVKLTSSLGQEAVGSAR